MEMKLLNLQRFHPSCLMNMAIELLTDVHQILVEYFHSLSGGATYQGCAKKKVRDKELVIWGYPVVYSKLNIALSGHADKP